MFSPREKKLVKTYARQRKPQPSLCDDKPASKRRRVIATPTTPTTVTTPDRLGVATSEESLKPKNSPYPYSTSPESSSSPIRNASAILTSSPKDDAPIFSDAARESTQPSSPLRPSSSPPRLESPQLVSSPPVPRRMRRPMFAFMKRKLVPRPIPISKTPLSESNSGENRQTGQPPKKKQKLVQMQLDLVGELRKKCITCGMEYIPSNAEDAGMHKRFHAQNMGGVDFSKPLVERLRQNTVWEGGNGGFVVSIGRRDGVALRNKAAEVLRVVNTELAAITVMDEVLWSLTREEEGKEKGRGRCDRFKVYLYISGGKCVGACLAERIQEAFAVVDPRQDEASGRTHTDPPPTIDRIDRIESSSISISLEPSPAMLGISRIWTSKLERKKGIASSLLEAARDHFLYGMRIEKSMVAFSQPTGNGGELARKWFGKRVGWSVYVDED